MVGVRLAVLKLYPGNGNRIGRAQRRFVLPLIAAMTQTKAAEVDKNLSTWHRIGRRLLAIMDRQGAGFVFYMGGIIGQNAHW